MNLAAIDRIASAVLYEGYLLYPYRAYRASAAMILNKVDLLPHVDFDVNRCIAYARQVNPKILVFQASATRGEGLLSFYDWVRDLAGERARGAHPSPGASA